MEPYVNAQGVTSEKAFVVRGSEEETRARKEDLKALGGKWNPNLNGGRGYIFSNKKKEAVQTYLETGELPSPKGSKESTPKGSPVRANELTLIRALQAQITEMSTKIDLILSRLEEAGFE